MRLDIPPLNASIIFKLSLGCIKGITNGHIDIFTAVFIMLFMTDGIVEAMNADRELYGFPRLEAVLQDCDLTNAQSVLNRVFDSVFEFMGDVSPQDDMTLVVVRVGGRR